jgi:hypothetical protein
MAFSPRAVLRPILATATCAILAASFAGACAAQDQDDAPAQGGGYNGPMLSWAGKTPQPPARRAPPVAPQDERSAYIERPAYVDRSAYVVRPRPPMTEPPPERAPLPPMVQSDPVPAQAPRAFAPPAEPPPAEQAQTPTPREFAPPPQPAPQAQASAASAPPGSPRVGVRLYSLHRQYGMTPDPIALPAKRPMVLIGPPDQPTTGAGSDNDDGGKPASHDGQTDGPGADGAGGPSGDN